MKLSDKCRFMAKVNAVDAGCWLWQASKDKDGYGKFWWDGQTGRAHIFSFLYLRTGLLNVGQQLDHICRVRACVNPEHLEAVTCRENILRGDGPGKKARQLYCKYGHLLSGINLYIAPGTPTQRHCKTCQRVNAKRWRESHVCSAH